MTAPSADPRLHAFFVFDAAYLGAALVSVASFLRHAGAARCPLTLVYLAGHADAAVELRVRATLVRFEQGVRTSHPGLALQLAEMQGNVFDRYVQRHHFSQAILYKAIIAQAFAQPAHILLFDCGLIFGQRLGDFLDAVEAGIRSRSISTMAAFCVPSDGPEGLPAELRPSPHHALYPDGKILYFDVAAYAQASVYERFVAAFAQHRERLVYAEQDLLCLTLKDDELGMLPECGVRRHIDLAGSDSWQTIDADDALYRSGDFFYLKHLGSFKPWKRWVLHPSKAIFLREQQALAAHVGAEAVQALRDTDLFPQQTGFLVQQMLLLEVHYEVSPPPVKHAP